MSLLCMVCFLFRTGVLDGELVAIKVVKKEYSDEAVKEVETMANFSHPNILHLIGIVQSSGEWKLGSFDSISLYCYCIFPSRIYWVSPRLFAVV